MRLRTTFAEDNRMLAEIAEAAAAVELINTARKQGWLDKLVMAVKKKHRVIVLGSTGVGKTNFLSSLTAVLPEAIDVMNRTQIAQKHRIQIKKEPFIFTDTPGQILHRSRRSEAAREAISRGTTGIINVVSYGYHEYRISPKDAFDQNDNVNEDFLRKHRNIEIEALQEWMPILGARDVADWLITVVTKADLWWDRRDEVLEYYRSGAYYDALGGAKSLNPVVL